MADNGNGKLSRAINVVLVGLVLLMMTGVAYNAKSNAATEQRVARLETQTEYIVRSLDRIEANLKEAIRDRARKTEGEKP